MTVKRWAPDIQPLGQLVINFALALFARLEIAVPKVEEIEVKEEVKDEDDMDMEDDDEKEEEEEEEGEKAAPVKVLPYAEVKDGEIVDRLPPPSTIPQVVQHVELLLALTVKNSDLLMK